MRLPVRIALFSLACLLAHSVAHATTLVRLSLDQLATGANAVARVRCLSVESHWEGGSIWTITTAEVVEVMKGNPPHQILVRLPGGRVGHFTASVDGAPRFHPGDEAVLFLSDSPAGGYAVAGWAEGTFRISRDPRTGAETVTQDSSAFAVFDPTARAFRSDGIRRMPFSEFRAQVARAIVSGQGASPGGERSP